MNKLVKSALAVALSTTLLNGCQTTQKQADVKSVGAAPKNIIMIVADGMGPVYPSAYRYYNDNPSTDIVESTVFDKHLVGSAITYPASVSGYAMSKQFFFSYSKAFLRSEVTKLINIELEHFFGPTAKEDNFISYIIDECLSHRDLKLTEGRQKRDFIYIEDVVSAFSHLLSNIKSLDYCESIALGSGTSIEIRELVKLVHDRSQSKSKLLFGAVKVRDKEVMQSSADLERLKSLGWEPKVELKEGIDNIISHRNTEYLL